MNWNKLRNRIKKESEQKSEERITPLFPKIQRTESELEQS